jgi:hypothetical protein
VSERLNEACPNRCAQDILTCMFEIRQEGAVYAVPLNSGNYGFVQHVGTMHSRPMVVVLDTIRDELPYVPEELDGVQALVQGGSLVYFVIEEHMDTKDALCEITVRWVSPGKRLPSIVRFSELSQRLVRELAPAANVEQAVPFRIATRTLLDDDGVLVVTKLCSVAAADDSFQYPDSLTQARARNELVYVETEEEGEFEIKEVAEKSDHEYIGILDASAAWWIMPLSTFTMGFDTRVGVVNALRLSGSERRASVYIAKRGKVIEIAYSTEIP